MATATTTTNSKKKATAKKGQTKPAANKKETALAINPPPAPPAPPVKPDSVIDNEKLSKRLETATNSIRKEIGGIAKSFVKIGYLLYKISDEMLFLGTVGNEGQQFKSVADYGEKVFGFQKSSVANYISICERFSVQKDGKPTAQLKPEFSNYSYGQLSLMLSVPDKKLPEITPDKTCSEIREIKKQENAKKELNGSKPSGGSAGSGVRGSKASDSQSSDTSKTSPSSSASCSASSQSATPASNLKVYIISWLYKGDLLKSATIQLPGDSDGLLHKEILVLFKNEWFDFGRDGDTLSISLAGDSK